MFNTLALYLANVGRFVQQYHSKQYIVIDFFNKLLQQSLLWVGHVADYLTIKLMKGKALRKHSLHEKTDYNR